MNSKVDIKGDVGFSIGLNHGAINVINNYGSGSGGGDELPIDPELKRAIHLLLSACDPIKQRELIQKIAIDIYGTKTFKSLEVEQVNTLAGITKNISYAFNEALDDQMQSLAREQNQFHKEYGMIASKSAREALLLLMEQNLTIQQVAQVWVKGMLTFEDDEQFHIHQSQIERSFGLFVFSLGVTFAIPAFFSVPVLEAFYPGGMTALGSGQTLAAIGMSLCASLSTFWVAINILTPHYIIKRVAKHTDKVNELLRARK